jgi:hypothetical protein
MADLTSLANQLDSKKCVCGAIIETPRGFRNKFDCDPPSVAVHSYDHAYVNSIGDVSKTLLHQLEEFFVSYNKQRGKKFKIVGTGKAIRFVKAGSEVTKPNDRQADAMPGQVILPRD